MTVASPGASIKVGGGESEFTFDSNPYIFVFIYFIFPFSSNVQYLLESALKVSATSGGRVSNKFTLTSEMIGLSVSLRKNPDSTAKRVFPKLTSSSTVVGSVVTLPVASASSIGSSVTSSHTIIAITSPSL